MKFTHLHVHSHYSLLQALPKIPELVEAAKKNGMESLALTDNGNLYGAIEFYKECKKAGIKPIIGVDAYVAGRSRFDKQAGVDKDRTRLILLTKDETGYKNLLKIVTASYLEGFYYKPRIDFEVMEKWSEGLIAISASWSGDISTALRGKNTDKAKELVEKYKKIYGKNFLIEITSHPELRGHNEHMKALANFAKENNTPVVVAHDVYYINPEDREARNTLMAVERGGPGALAELGASALGGGDEEEDLSFLTAEEIKKRFEWLPEALQNNALVASLCNLELPLGKWVFPNLKIESGRTAEEELRVLAYEGIKKRKLRETKEITDRIEYELDIIKKKGFSPYLLIVADLIRYAREREILFNIRGSVSGSLVTYAIGMTSVNPIEYEIPFERFLNPDRPSAPDIDMDYADRRRDEIIEYVKQKYGADKVAQVGTFGTMMARGSVRDTGRAMGFGYNVGDRIAKLIPLGQQGFPMSIDRAMKEVPELRELYKKDADSKKVIDMARKIEGCARHISIHAAGVVISPTALTEFTPLQYDPKGLSAQAGENKVITQYDMYSIEEAGLLKFDFLGLANLSIITDTISLLRKTKNIEIDIETIPKDDKKTFEMLARGETEGLFQLNGDGMTRFLVELRPTSIHDINAMVALYRPGPMQFISKYIECKHDPSKVKYLDPALQPILEKTYGVLVYQDDLLMMAHNLAGYSWGEVDKFRKAVGKKIPREMAEQKEKFINGCIEHSKWSEKKAREIWSWIEPFAAYGFNKAHSVNYGLIAYRTAYLKANFPGEYMTAVLSSELGEVEKVATSINECKRIGIEVLPPDINESYKDFTLIQGNDPPSQSYGAAREKIRFGLGSIKNFGEGIADFIITERKKNGLFKSMEDFLTRVQDRNLNKKSLEALIKSGAMDNLVKGLSSRGRLLANMETLLEYNKESGSTKNHESLFATVDQGPTPLHLKEAPEPSHAEQLKWEKELLGLYISGHPLDKFKEKLKAQKTTIKKVKEETKEGDIVVVGGMLQEVKPYLTRNGEKMLFTKITDLTDSIEMAVFPRTLSEYPNMFNLDQCIIVKARITIRNPARPGFATPDSLRDSGEPAGGEPGGGEKSLIAEKAKIL